MLKVFFILFYLFIKTKRSLENSQSNVSLTYFFGCRGATVVVVDNLVLITMFPSSAERIHSCTHLAQKTVLEVLRLAKRPYTLYEFYQAYATAP